MTLKEVTLNSRAGATLYTELLYAVASARAQGYAFLKLMISNETKEYVQLQKELRALKKQGRIQIHLVAENFFGQSKEAMYLRNKYPELRDFCSEGDTNVIVWL